MALACGSRSISRTRCPWRPSPMARLTAVVVLPTPPFWFEMAYVCICVRRAELHVHPSSVYYILACDTRWVKRMGRLEMTYQSAPNPGARSESDAVRRHRLWSTRVAGSPNTSLALSTSEIASRSVTRLPKAALTARFM